MKLKQFGLLCLKTEFNQMLQWNFVVFNTNSDTSLLHRDLDTTSMCDELNRDTNLPPIGDTYQLNDAAPIKQETDIKEEPQQSVGDSVEFLSLDRRDDGQSSCDIIQTDNEDDPMNSSIDDVKSEVKEEPSEQIVTEPKPNNSNVNMNEIVTNDQRDHTPEQERRAPGQQID